MFICTHPSIVCHAIGAMNKRFVGSSQPPAREHLERAWELVAILERNDVLIWTIKSPRTGYVHYEDEVQVFARPYDDVRYSLGGKRK